MKRVQITIKGRVQGVFFRAFIKDRAIELGLTGYTRNVNTQVVEAIVEGHEIKINQLIEACKSGPSGAEIQEIKVTSLPYTGEFKQFRVKY